MGYLLIYEHGNDEGDIKLKTFVIYKTHTYLTWKSRECRIKFRMSNNEEEFLCVIFWISHCGRSSLCEHPWAYTL